MPDGPSDDDKIRVFISYASADREIAQVLYDELTEIDRNRVECFFDVRTIESGAEWKQILKRELRRAEWLICIYTGEQSEFCGFEVGYFADANDGKASQDARVVCLHDVADLPGIYSGYQSRRIISPSETPPGAPLPDESTFYKAAPLAKFLNDFCKYRDLYRIRDLSDATRQEASLLAKVKRITEAFVSARGSDEKSSTPIQLGIEIRIAKVAEGKMEAIPPTAEVSGTYESLKLFGLQPPMQQERLPRTTWQELREASTSPRNPNVLWMDKLQADIVNAANGRAVSAPEATLRSKSNEKIYRPILARHVEYFGGSRLFSVLFVETLPRQFMGRKNTSMLLAGLVLASRFRFAYLEDGEEVFAKLFGDGLSDEEFEANCTQLKYNLEQMSHEAADFGLLDNDTFVKAFGVENRAKAENFLKNWDETEKRLNLKLPTMETRITPENRSDIKSALTEFFASVEVENEKFTLAAIDVFRAEVETGFRHREASVGRLAQ
ncbi:toll/interleukin-1 receptor domain-containing protein [Variovorax sp. GT1P44]|uniref:toll/interleukin-1 receptor domain-containing protein n=1 Tax=Variovorax sp. GT1P44 TaxID=3443742 RepID=UPI003F485A8B